MNWAGPHGLPLLDEGGSGGSTGVSGVMRNKGGKACRLHRVQLWLLTTAEDREPLWED